MGNGGGIFQVSEIVQMAVDEEHNGYYFYKTLAECADHPGLREMAVTLAEQEQGHEKAFIKLRDELGAALDAGDFKTVSWSAIVALALRALDQKGA